MTLLSEDIPDTHTEDMVDTFRSHACAPSVEYTRSQGALHIVHRRSGLTSTEPSAPVGSVEAIADEDYSELVRRAEREIKTKPRRRPVNVKKQLVKERDYKNKTVEDEHVVDRKLSCDEVVREANQTLQSGEPCCAAQERRAGTARAGLYPRSQLGLHGHGVVGLDDQSLGRAKAGCAPEVAITPPARGTHR